LDKIRYSSFIHHLSWLMQRSKIAKQIQTVPNHTEPES
jgi:hypothetical protein